VARKNPFANLVDEDKVHSVQPVLEYAMKGASRSILSSIDEMAARADKLIEGETVIELDPNLIDVSFVQDRLSADDEEFNELLEAIRDRGQDSPILLRPHPTKTGRYMVVFGHRRLRAAALLRRNVRAVLKDMRDRDHVIAQGQENSARANLSFIEKAFFASNLARRNFDEDNATIVAALGIDRTTLSKMLSVAGLPGDILRAIGPAKAIGRDRWYELKLLLEKPLGLEIAQTEIAKEGFASLSSDERFYLVVARLKTAVNSSRLRAVIRKKSWVPQDGSLSAEMTIEGKRFTLALKARGTGAKEFGEYLSENLDQFFEAFRRNTKPLKHGD
jgi:ParB family chromosome partitioning protein